MNNIFYLKKLKEKINYFFTIEGEEKIKIENLMSYYNSLLNHNDFLQNRKHLIFIYFSKINENYLKNWLIDLLVKSILNIEKNQLYVDNNLFLEIIKNKKIIKNFFNKQLSLIYLNSFFISKIINNEKGLNLIKNKDRIGDLFIENIFNINKILNINETISLENENSIFNYFFDFRKNLLIEHENKIFDLIDNKNLFSKNKNNEIIISSHFKDFLFVVFNINVKDKSLNLENYNHQSLKKEFKKIFLLNN